MITNTNKLRGSSLSTNASVRPSTARPAPAPEAAAGADTLSMTHASRLQSALAQTPAVRADAIERAAPLANDPNYPTQEIVGKIGRIIVQSKDPSLQED